VVALVPVHPEITVGTGEYREHGRHASRVLHSHENESKVPGRGDWRCSSTPIVCAA
jgi:hypothetical protein